MWMVQTLRLKQLASNIFRPHIDLVVDFINLGLAKRLRHDDAVRALYSGLLASACFPVKY